MDSVQGVRGPPLFGRFREKLALVPWPVGFTHIHIKEKSWSNRIVMGGRGGAHGTEGKKLREGNALVLSIHLCECICR